MSVFVARQHHTRVSRTLVDDSATGVVPREPQLLKLPIPVPSIPILNPVITPLVGGPKPPANSPAPTPAPQPTSPGGGGGNGGGGGGNGGGSGGNGGNGNGGGGGNGGGNENGDGGGNGNGDGGNDDGNGNGNGGGGSPQDDGSNPGDTSTTTGDSDSSSGGATGTSGQSSPSDSTSTSSSTGSTLAADNGQDGSNTGDGSVNAGEDPDDRGSTGSHGKNSGSEAHGAISTGHSDPGSTTRGDIGAGNPGSTDAPGGGIDGAGATGTGGKTGGLSSGAVAGIVIVLLLLASAVFIIFLRRRRSARRSERRDRWWFARKRNSRTYGDGNNAEAGVDANGRQSVRSSFATTYDHSQTPRLTVEFDIPPLPPMAEVRGEPLLVNFDSPTSPIGATTPINQSRYSVGTISSVGSDGQGQYLVVNRDNLLKPEVGTPMSVRPFSPTESFAFPKPPPSADKNSGDWGSQISRPTSSHTLVGVPSRSPVIEAPPTPAIPDLTVNPFSDNNELSVDILPIPNPFADPLPPEPSTPSSVHPEFMEVETIKRPFIPNLEDELFVVIDDKVKILQMFDDGWALVEKNPVFSTLDSKGKGKGKAYDEKLSEKGLIPIDCFREPGLDLSSFITAKRVSSYSQTSGDVSGFMAL